jgi:glutathione S-transferase
MLTLYQLQCSHFCEKARWALDYKGIPYLQKNLVPGPHRIVSKRLAPKSCLPILVDDDQVIQDSTAIIDYLDRTFVEPRLTPEDPVEARKAIEWEEYLDEEVGVTLRLWFYFHALPDRPLATRFLLEGAPWYGRPLYALIFPKLRSAMNQMMCINERSAREAKDRLEKAFEKLDLELRERQFLVGDHFSRADLAACALLAPFCRPGEPPDEVSRTVPAPVSALRDRHKNDRFFAYVCDTYREYRG